MSNHDEMDIIDQHHRLKPTITTSSIPNIITGRVYHYGCCNSDASLSCNNDIMKSYKRKRRSNDNVAEVSSEASFITIPYNGYIIETSTNQYSILCIPSQYESILYDAYQYQHVIQITHYIIIPLICIVKQQQESQQHQHTSYITLLRHKVNQMYQNSKAFHDEYDSDHHTLQPFIHISSILCIPNHHTNNDVIRIVSSSLHPCPQAPQRPVSSMLNNIVKSTSSSTTTIIQRNTSNRTIIDSDSYCTLYQLAIYEMINRLEHDRTNNKRSSSSTAKNANKYNICGMVQYISPILIMNPDKNNNDDDAFILMELVDIPNHHDDDTQNQQQQYQCTIVIRHIDICMMYHHRIHPYDILYIQNMKKQQWLIPTILMKHYHSTTKLPCTQQQQIVSSSSSSNDIPSHSVFIIDSIHQIQSIQSLSQYQQQRQSLPSIHRMFVPIGNHIHHHHSTFQTCNVHTIIGWITNVQYMKYISTDPNLKKNTNKSCSSSHLYDRTIHLLELHTTTLLPDDISSSSTSCKIITLLVTYYPLAITIQLLLHKLYQQQKSLPPPSTTIHQDDDDTTSKRNDHTNNVCIQICASNVRRIGYTCFVAQLFSHISLLNVTTTSPAISTLESVQHSSIPEPMKDTDRTESSSQILFTEPLNVQSNTIIPYTLLKIRHSYHQLWIRHIVYRTSIIQDIQQSNKSNRRMPSNDEIYDGLQFISQYHHTDGINKYTHHSPTRNVYQEFFTRPMINSPQQDDMNENIERISNNDNDVDDALPLGPYPINIHKIQKISFHTFIQRLQSYIKVHHRDSQQQQPMDIGWTSSIHWTGLSLYETFLPELYTDDQHIYPRLYTFGHCSISTRHGFCTASISNGAISLPIVFCNHEVISTSDFAWTRIKSINMSCICIGTNRNDNSTTTGDEGIPIYPQSPSECCTMLLPYQESMAVPKEDTGPCGICMLHGYVFMISLYLICDRYQSIPLLESNTDKTIHDETSNVTSSNITIEECLNPEMHQMKSDSPNHTSSVFGLLNRGSFKLGKIKSNVYSGYTMNIAHLLSDTATESTNSVLSTIQSIDVKSSIRIDMSKLSAIQNAMSVLLDDNNVTVPEERLTLGAVWWKLACNPRICALLGGGWDYYVPNKSNEGSLHSSHVFGMVAYLPVTSIHRDPKRGYIRCRCNIDDIDVGIRCYQKHKMDKLCMDTSSHYFDYIGRTGNFLTGMVNHRPRRCKYGNMRFGELLVGPNESDDGIPQYTLADLLVCTCLDLQLPSGGRYHLSPSMVRAITNAKFLGIKYCRIYAECSRCYATLRGPQQLQKTHQHCFDGSIDDSNEMNLYQEVSTTRTYNHRIIGRNETKLQCPNGCRAMVHGTIKWECSGIIDDMTGQGKLCAERDVAICLLGMSQHQVQVIESAVWQSYTNDGLIYNINVPLSSSIRDDILLARSMAVQQLHRYHIDYRKMTDADVQQFISPQVYAEYILYQHCYTSLEPYRDLIYYVSCKPLSDTSTSLNQTEIDILRTNLDHHTIGTNNNINNRSNTITVATNVTQTYSLPPLILNLVDCCVRS